MNDEIWQRDEIESPCVKICVIHPREKICVGCFRTEEEIASWSTLAPQKRHDLMSELPNREKLLTKRRSKSSHKT